MELTDEQQAISDYIPEFLSSTLKALGMKAFAGCGKSSILKYIAKKYPDIRIQGLAFNASIVAENKRSFPRKNCNWSSVHKFAKDNLLTQNIQFDLSKTINNFKAVELFDILGIKDSGNYALANSINEVMKVYCQSSLPKITPELIQKAGRAQLNHKIVSIPDGLLEQACEYTRNLWDIHEKGVIPPTFDFYLKYFEVNQYAREIKKFDLLELDEAQDSNAVTLSIATQMPTKNLYTGDNHQSIYAFRGTLDAMRYADKLFYLSTTFRYVPSIAKLANNILKTYKGETVPIRSLVEDKSVAGGTTAYLARNNSSMIGLIDELIKANIYFKTVKKPEELFGLAISLLEFRTKNEISNPDYFYLKSHFSDIDEIEEYYKESNDAELKTAFGIQRRFGKRLYTILRDAKNNMQSKEKAKYILATAHTSKGLEWDHVELIDDFPDIQRKLNDAKIKNSRDLIDRANMNERIAAEIVQEINLYYVAVTRAKYSVGTKVMKK